MIRKVAVKDEKLCSHCGFCESALTCPGSSVCFGCGACVAACPNKARRLEYIPHEGRKVKVKIDGCFYDFPARITLLEALQQAGYDVSWLPGEGQISAPCRTGGCWSCAVLVNGKLKPSCTTPIYSGMEVITDSVAIKERPPLRLVSGFQPHQAGGVGTPFALKPTGPSSQYIEVACFTHGCTLRCPTCQNWVINYTSKGVPSTPREAAQLLTKRRQEFQVNRIAISGGESTINRRWLLELLKNLRELNSPDVHLHVDTNTVTLTPDFIDELVAAGMTDIGPDLKAVHLDTFIEITGVEDRELADKLLKRSWTAVEYLLRNYHDKIFIGIGIPCNPGFVSVEEILEAGRRLAKIEPDVQVTLLDYRPEFRRQDIIQPSPTQMLKLKELMEETGLECVTCQTTIGHFGP